TEAGRPSRRSGIEFANYLRPVRWLVVDADVSWSRARFTDRDPAGAFIPGSVETVVSGGVTVENLRRVYASARVRYFGARPLLEDNRIRSNPTKLVNVELGYRWSAKWRLALDALNLLNAADSDIDYVYVSRLPGEPPGGVEDRHFHPVLPRTFRLTLTVGL
ncbi:MAG: TonB-dependent receptor, partial [Vicinamibacterales bacterium]